MRAWFPEPAERQIDLSFASPEHRPLALCMNLPTTFLLRLERRCKRWHGRDCCFLCPVVFSHNSWEVNSCALPDSCLQMRLQWGWWLCPLQAALLLGGSLEMAPDTLVLTPSLPPCALALLCAPSISYWHTRLHTQRVSTHTLLCFSFFFGFLLLYCFKLVAGLSPV